MKTKKGLHVRRCRVFTENVGEDQKKRSSLFMMRPLIFSEAPIFSEALGFSLHGLLVNPAFIDVLTAYFEMSLFSVLSCNFRMNYILLLYS